ncbi:MAG: cytochrome-c oxidase, cbb3-type subunit III [Xanthomonadales bacterium]|nr:cytochrome-c oxidase, cbb3-type subunit III [Xanthomonadales bacterium]
MSLGWQVYVLIITVATLVAHILLLTWTSRIKIEQDQSAENTTGHVWDGDLTEYNNPLPRWWLLLFHGTIVFGVIYLVLYPGSGVYGGILGWSQEDQYAEQVTEAEARYGPIFEEYARQDIPTLAQNAEAMEAGFNLFGNNCAQCHGSDGRGATGFPNLTDDDWQWGGAPQQILTSISNGRVAAMPGWQAALGGPQQVENMAHYVLSLSGLDHDAAKAAEAQPKYGMFCAACHGPQAKGNVALGAPNLTDEAWVYEPTMDSLTTTIAEGRNGQMPAFEQTLGEDRVKVLAAYVYSMSSDQ